MKFQFPVWLVVVALVGRSLLAESLQSEEVDALLTGLQGKSERSAARQIDFREERHFPFRNKPVELKGVLRLWDEKGVSISYPEERTMIIADEEGVLLRKEGKLGGVREKVARISESGTIGLFRQVFDFDPAVLRERFEIEGERDEESWTVVLTPKNAEERKIESIALTGEGLELQRISMRFDRDRRIEIHPEGEVAKEAFSEEEAERYFRTSEK